MPLIRNSFSKNATGTSEPSNIAASLNGASAEERWGAARAAFDGSVSVADLAKALAIEREPRIREVIFTALARIATPESAAAILPHLRSDDADLRTAALDALRAMQAAIAPHLPQLLVDTDPDVRLLACDLVRDVPRTEALKLLLSVLETDGNANVCAGAVEVLVEIADANSIPALLQCEARFPNDPFLGFAIKIALDRLSSELPPSRV